VTQVTDHPVANASNTSINHLFPGVNHENQ
jgi:hypothetical protein